MRIDAFILYVCCFYILLYNPFLYIWHEEKRNGERKREREREKGRERENSLVNLNYRFKPEKSNKCVLRMPLIELKLCFSQY